MIYDDEYALSNTVTKFETDKQLNFMVDIETFGSDEKTVVSAVAVVPFTDKVEPQFSIYRRIDLSTYKGLNYNMSLDTVKWWMQQSEKARMEILKGRGTTLYSVINELIELKQLHPNAMWWAKSPIFDIKILNSWCKEFGLELMCERSNTRCVRTLFGLADTWNIDYSLENAQFHNPWFDSHVQAKQICTINNKVDLYIP